MELLLRLPSSLFSHQHLSKPFSSSSPSSPSPSSVVFFLFSNNKAVQSCSQILAPIAVTRNGATLFACQASASATISAEANTKWIVAMEPPRAERCSTRSDVVDYYVETLAKVLGSEKEAQMCIYHASWQIQFGFSCDIDEEASHQLACLPGVLSVNPDENSECSNKYYGNSNPYLGKHSISDGHRSKFTSAGEHSEYWIVRMEKPGIEVVTRAQMVDYYAHTLAKVMGNEKDAEVSIYHISWENDFGFCCQIDEDCAQELADVPGVLSVSPDVNFDSAIKDYKDDKMVQSLCGSSEASQTPEIKTKRLFVTGLSFYTSEKTLRAAFEPFGELIEVKIIMDKISKRSKGYAFIEYTTEEAGGAALKEMNGKIINGWMIVVDVARTNPPNYGRGGCKHQVHQLLR